ncbi:MAG: AraC family transcriptional regulator [Lachnospiraceae bacterium]|nr:AraC family transcriptional regulator [Lachnospiraceae bacterium]
MRKLRRTYISGSFHILDESHHAGYIMAQYHYHEPIEVFILTKGRCRFWVDGDLHELRPSQLILFPRNTSHKIHVETPIHNLTFHFSEEYIRECYPAEIAERLLLPLGTCRVITLTTKSMAQIRRIVDEMASVPGWEYLHLAELIRILTLYRSQTHKKNAAAAPESETAERFSQILQFINDNYASVTSIAEVSDRLHVSESSLCRMFRSKLDSTPTEYINRLKIEYACNRLVESHRSVTQIGHDCGFESCSYFVRVFKRVTGCTPSQYREQNHDQLSQQRQYVDGSRNTVLLNKPGAGLRRAPTP